MYILNLVRIDYAADCDDELKSIKASFVGDTTDECAKPLADWFNEKRRRVEMYYANGRIYPRFELEVMSTEHVVIGGNLNSQE
jgi:hypothetical protein